MIASTAALFAILASLTAGHAFNVLPNPMTRNQAIAACQAKGQQLASLTGASIDEVSALLPAGKSGWIASWNGDSYSGACLQLAQGTVTVAQSCDDQLLAICQGGAAPAPCPPHEPSCSSSSSISCSSESSHSEPSCESSSSSFCPSSSSWGCSSSSASESCSESSFSCSSSFDSSICSSSSSSSSGKCDPCCAGVRKLTYQAPFGPGIYLAKVAQRFSVFDVFGPNACENVQTLAATLGVNAVLVASNGTNACLLPDGEQDTTPYGAYYTVSRAWALNQPIYSLWNGTVYAANSLYNCYGEYRAILLNKSLSELTFVTNNHGNVCFERCKGKKDCLALCNGLPRPSYLPKFEMPK